MKIGVLFLTAYLVGFSGAIAPGPLLTVTINESFRRGFIAGPLLITGHAVLEMFTVVLIASGFYRLIGGNRVYAAIAFVGGAFLLWMGWQMAAGAARYTIRLELDAGATGGKAGPVLLGMITSVSNPYFVLWWLTIGAGYVIYSKELGIAGLAAFFLGHILADYTWYTLVSAAVAGGKRFINQRVYRLVVLTCGVFLLGMAIYFLQSGFIFLNKAV